MHLPTFESSQEPTPAPAQGRAQASVSISGPFSGHQESACYIHKPSDTVVCGQPDHLSSILDCSDPHASLVPISEDDDDNSVYTTLYCPTTGCNQHKGCFTHHQHDDYRDDHAKFDWAFWLIDKIPTFLQDLLPPSLRVVATPQSPPPCAGRGREHYKEQHHHARRALRTRKSRPKGTGSGNSSAAPASAKAVGALAGSVAAGWVLVWGLR